VDSPAGSVVIGGDSASNLTVVERVHLTSDELETLTQGADVLVHAALHPVLSPETGSGMPGAVNDRQSNVAARAGVVTVMLTHLGPAFGAPAQGPWIIAGGSRWRICRSPRCRDGSGKLRPVAGQ
jgi:ribonuclease Z